MAKKRRLKANIFRGIAILCSLALGVSITASSIMEIYYDQIDAALHTTSYMNVTDYSGDENDAWNYDTQYRSGAAAFEALKEFAIRASTETNVLLKNENSTLPIAKNAKVTLLGLRSYAAVYGTTSNGVADRRTTEDNLIYDAFKAEGFQLNPTMLQTYADYCKTLTWSSGDDQYKTNTVPEYAELTVYDDIPELSIDELTQINSDFQQDFDSYNDAAIVVVGRPSAEGAGYYPHQEGMKDGLHTTTDNIMGLSTEEKEIIELAKSKFDKVIVLINSTTFMEFGDLKDDPDIDAIMWIGYPGAYGFHGVAKCLNGEANPSGHLGDTYVRNGAVAPSMQSFGDIPWKDLKNYPSANANNINSYLVEAEGIYQGYRYYETRYADIVAGVPGAATAKAGTWTTQDGKIATTEGTWDYGREVVYPFGYGLSYTTFSQSLDNVVIAGDKLTATVTVTVTNTGNVAGKDVVQLYAQTPYTDYDKTNHVEKSAVQLMDYEKTELLAPGQSQTITMTVDMHNIASYDYTNARTYIADAGEYYFTLGNGSHEALNNILTAKGMSTADGMDANGNANLTYKWTWDELDTSTFSISETGTKITNVLTEGMYAMDLNYFMPDTVTYLSRSDWNGTYPVSYGRQKNTVSGANDLGAGEFAAAFSENLAIGDGKVVNGVNELEKLMLNDIYEVGSGQDTSSVVFGDKTSELTLNDLKGVEWGDPRIEELANKMTIPDFLNFAGNAFHVVTEIPSIGYVGNLSDDGSSGSDMHLLPEGQYRGEAWEDAAEYENYGTRVAPSPTNLAYAWNKELAFEHGDLLLGQAYLWLNIAMDVGPGANLHRHGYNARGYEYFSEDPILSGYTLSADVQGAQMNGIAVNIKHTFFNDQEINRGGVAVFMNEQKARELELRNFQQAFVANGKPASFADRNDIYNVGALGTMTAYNRIGASASSGNKAAMQDIMRDEWGFHGYNVTDFTGVTIKATPKESVLYGTTAFCGFAEWFGTPEYWNEAAIKGDLELSQAVHKDAMYIIYALANSAALNGVNSTTTRVWLMNSWRAAYITCIAVSAVLAGGSLVGAIVCDIIDNKKKRSEG